jgi:hypothetical protein
VGLTDAVFRVTDLVNKAQQGLAAVRVFDQYLTTV